MATPQAQQQPVVKVTLTIVMLGGKSVGKTSLIERLSPVCPYCSVNDYLKNVPKEEQAEEKKKELKSKAKQNATVETGWSMERNEVKSLKFWARHSIVKNNVEFDSKLLPEELVDFISEARNISCLRCKTMLIQYLNETNNSYAYFDKPLHTNPKKAPLIRAPLTSLPPPSNGKEEITNSNNDNNKMEIVEDEEESYQPPPDHPFFSGFRIVDSPAFSSDLNDTKDDSILKLFANQIPAFVLVYDVSRRSTFELIPHIVGKLKTLGTARTKPKPVICIVGTKIDKIRNVSFEEGETLAKEHEALFFEINARSTYLTSNKLFHAILENVEKTYGMPGATNITTLSNIAANANSNSSAVGGWTSWCSIV